VLNAVAELKSAALHMVHPGSDKFNPFDIS